MVYMYDLVNDRYSVGKPLVKLTSIQKNFRPKHVLEYKKDYLANGTLYGMIFNCFLC